MATIVEKEDGPLAVHDATGLVDSNGQRQDIDSPAFLCRCGRSNNKPYCDGTHVKAGFSSRTENDPSGEDAIKQYQGDRISVLYNPRICAHAAECIRLAPKVFDPNEKPWIKPDADTDERIRKAVAACPSGALRIDQEPHTCPNQVTVRVQEDGPYWITDADIDPPLPGVGGSKEKYTLCRCGLSGSKPYCDGTHYDQKWRSDD